MRFSGCGTQQGPGVTSKRCLQGVHAITDAGPWHLAKCGRLRALDISHCWKTTDEGMVHLSSMSVLAHLDIAYCWQVWCPLLSPLLCDLHAEA